MKRLTTFCLMVLQELGDWCGTSTVRDGKTITDRIECEGYSFLTITLPGFGKDFERSLDQGYVDRSLFTGYARTGGLPRFLGGFLDLVFERKSGVLLLEPSIVAIRSIRQFTLMFGKIDLPCSDERTRAALTGFKKCEKDLILSDTNFHLQQEEFVRMSRLLYADFFSEVDRLIFDGEIVPKHGPGATAEKLRGNAKYTQYEWPARLEEYFPSGEYIFPSWRHYDASRVETLEPGAERPVRVITVPKTLKTPRIIAIEPTCMQYVQQGILEAMTRETRVFDNTRNFVCSDSQVPNRELAAVGSLTGTLATLDMSEASDRVSNLHVEALLRDHPHFRAGVQACRSTKADVDGEIVHLSKFASMGSALCFPFEALVFSTIVFMGISRALGHQLSQKDVESFYGKVRVYGDDIIVPVEFVPSVVESLESFGMKVNSNKSFWTGKFRESCGGDFYDGANVTPVRIRQDFPTQLTDVKEIVSTSELRNHLFEAGFESTVDWLDKVLTRALKGRYPYIRPTSPGIGRWTHDPLKVTRVHHGLQKPLVRAYVSRSVIPVSKLDGVDALTKWFLKRGLDPFQDKDHLQRSGRPSAVSIKQRWVSPV